MKTLKQDWLTGKTQQSILWEIITDARSYFIEWSEKDLRKCFEDLEKILYAIISKKTNKYITKLDHYVILSLPSVFLINNKPFITFLKKWIVKLEGKFKSSKGKPNYRAYYAIASLFILKSAADDEIINAIQMNKLLTYWQGRNELENNPTLELEMKVKSKAARKSANTPRIKSLLILEIENVILKDPDNASYMKVKKALKEKAGNGVIKSVTNEGICWQDHKNKSKKTSIKGLQNHITRIKKATSRK